MLAPEPIFSAYLEVVYRVAVYVRNRSRGANRISDDQLFDLMDAIHNIPEFLTRYGEFFTEDLMRHTYLGVYDSHWAVHGGFSLVEVVNEAMAKAQQRKE
jgi:hypothetical protein